MKEFGFGSTRKKFEKGRRKEKERKIRGLP
jgi:hypothetical protein